MFRIVAVLLVCALHASLLCAAPPNMDTARGDKMIAAYFEQETVKLRDRCLDEVQTIADWEARREQYRGELLEMLGLDPLPEKTPLEVHVTGRVEHEDFIVENLHFQSRPGLYVTGNVYRPREVTKPLPAILYVCGHGRVAKDGISYGNKTHYQHHGAWFARNGYVCLTIDTLQLGEIEGIHHGTYRYDMWWWLNRGYTPAGVEAWNCVRALDYLESRDDVDADRIGVTGRSGGGAYSWWIAAIDDRIKVAVPVAGITDLTNHVVDGCVEGHCDCMYMLNSYRWDYAKVAALVAPRPLLISNTDSDRIFPLDGVVRTFEQVRRIYALHDAAEDVALNITAGPHKDTQELRIHAFRWFNHHLREDDELIEKVAVKYFEPEQLRVFSELPVDEANTKIHESFVRAAEVTAPSSTKQWRAARDDFRSALLTKSFAAWPKENEPLELREIFDTESGGIRFRAYDFASQTPIRLRLYVAHRAGLDKPNLTVLNVLDEASWMEMLATFRPAFEEHLSDETLPDGDQDLFKQLQQMFESFPWAMAYVCPRGIGPTAWDQSEKKQTQHRRRFYLLGQTLDAMRAWDTRRAIAASRAVDGLSDVPLWLQSHRRMAGVALYASLFEPEIARLDLYDLPTSHRDGPYLLNVRRFLDMPQAVAMAAERSRVVIYGGDEMDWRYVTQVGKLLDWEPKQFQLRKLPVEE